MVNSHADPQSRLTVSGLVNRCDRGGQSPRIVTNQGQSVCPLGQDREFTVATRLAIPALPIQSGFQRRLGYSAFKAVLGQRLFGRTALAESLHVNGDEKPELQSLKVTRAASTHGGNAVPRLGHDVTLPFVNPFSAATGDADSCSRRTMLVTRAKSYCKIRP